MITTKNVIQCDAGKRKLKVKGRNGQSAAIKKNNSHSTTSKGKEQSESRSNCKILANIAKQYSN
jgi:hypothetical protein